MCDRPGRVLLNSFVDRTGVREHDFDTGFLQPIPDRQTHPAADHDVAVADRVDEIVMSTTVPRFRVVALRAGADVADLPRHLDSVFKADDNEGLGTTEVSGDSRSVQSGKCNLHGMQHTVDSL